MYPEFVPIYIMLGVIALLLIVAIILLIVLLKKQGSNSRPRNYYAPQQPQQYGRAPQNQGGQPSGGMAFCRNCGAQFDASHRVCPRCGTPRS